MVILKKDEFKEFVKKNPKLISFVKKNEMTWQKFYEMYDLYGEDEGVWSEYISKDLVNDNVSSNTSTNTISSITFNEILNWFKNIDLDSLQESIGNFQRVLGVVQDLSKKDSKDTLNSTYKPRPLYKHFED